MEEEIKTNILHEVKGTEERQEVCPLMEAGGVKGIIIYIATSKLIIILIIKKRLLITPELA